MERLPNSLSFRIVTTLTVDDERQIPQGYTGRVRVRGALGPVSELWLADGVLDDPADDVPAFTRLRADGSVKQRRHYRAGRLHDPAHGVPAVTGYHPDGSLRYAEHFRYGWRNDVGEVPAIRKWRADGTLRSVRHYRDNVRLDRPVEEHHTRSVRHPRPATS